MLGAVANEGDGQIWGEQQGWSCLRKTTKRYILAFGALAGGAALALGLFTGQSKEVSGSSSRALMEATDSASLGCFYDRRHSRLMTDLLSDDLMTPPLCKNHCEGLGAAYYGLQYGTECWCGSGDVELDRFSEDGAGAVCDFPCGGDTSSICGGYLAMTAYDIAVATEPVEREAPTTTPSGGGSGSTECSGDPTYRWASSSNIMYIESGGCGTFTGIYEAYPNGPVKVLDEDDKVIEGGSPTGYWLLMSSLTVYDGAVLQCHGVSDGGDCDVLRIQSDGSKDFHEVRGHGGSLSFYGTKVTSWDTDEGEQQKTYKGGRSFINCVSEVQSPSADCAKNDRGECRMDIINSEMGDLGWFDAESYGLTWKVRGFCPDLSNPEVFDEVQVYGDIQGSDIYGMYYGMYSYGHQGGVWTNNKMHDNILYGFDPHDDSDELEIAYNEVWGNGNHGIIASKRCNDVSIHDNEVYSGGPDAVGIFLHRSTDNAVVYNNYVHEMQDAGIAIMESMDGDIYDNVFENVKYGIRVSLGGANNKIHDNVFDTCSSYGLYTYEGSDPPAVSNGRPSGNVFEDNKIYNTEVGAKIKDGDDNEFIGNEFTGTEYFEFEDSDNTLWSGNTIPSGACIDGSTEWATGSDPPPDC